VEEGADHEPCEQRCLVGVGPGDHDIDKMASGDLGARCVSTLPSSSKMSVSEYKVVAAADIAKRRPMITRMKCIIHNNERGKLNVEAQGVIF